LENLKNKVNNPNFSLGLSFFEIIDLSAVDLKSFLTHTPREEIISWLQWNDPNGVYEDNTSLHEFGNILTKQEGIEIIMRQISEA
jgi:hypothetical protein